MLAPECEWANGWLGLGTACDYSIDSGWYAGDPSYLPYFDIVVGQPAGPYKGRLLRVADSAACAATGNGWYFDNPQHPTSLHICPNACDCAQQASESFSVAMGCWGNAAPGVLDAEIPCPRCPASRPKQCGTAGTMWGTLLSNCEFPVDNGAPNMYMGDPTVINLLYLQNGASAGEAEPWDGYLTYVPSLADCDSVEEGWTFDMSTASPTVKICPSACSCAKVKGAAILVEQGCPRHEAQGK
ncbi:MAG: hypothetical protein HY898_14340 [Deltaproteobacteria bacterium]|nr:hypothetical protein [Deltaproteobacteria bacterium]